MSKYWCILLFNLIFLDHYGQEVRLIAPNANGTASTSYIGLEDQDSIFVFCESAMNESGVELTAYVENTTDLFLFDWYKFNPNSNIFESYLLDNQLNESTISNLEDGGYAVYVYSQLGDLVGCNKAWVYKNNPIININKLPTTCGPFQLHANIEHQNEFTYYNPPVEELTIDVNTEITVCFSAEHDYVSDIGFYLIGPPSCGSPRIKLMEAFAISQSNEVCNSGDNVDNLCFSTNSSVFIDEPCKAKTPLSGTYASAEGWSKLYGCQANLPGWKVQIFDCIGGDIGTLTHAQIVFKAETGTCKPVQIIYDSGEIETVINDNSCNEQDASSFVVESIASTPLTIPNEVRFSWTEDAPFFELSNNGKGQSIVVPRPPKVQTLFSVSSIDDFGCTSNSEITYYFEPSSTPIISAIPELCNNYNSVHLQAYPATGKWDGKGITDADNGIFNPKNAVGWSRVFYTDTSMCGGIASDSIFVKTTPHAELIENSPLCDNDTDGSIEVSSADTGYWNVVWMNNNWDTIAQKNKWNPILENISIGIYHGLHTFSNHCKDTLSVDFVSQQLADVSIYPSVTETSTEVPEVVLQGAWETPLENYYFTLDDKLVAENVQSYRHIFEKRPKTYVAKFIGNDELGCVDTASTEIELIHAFAFYVPSTFTPNNDGINDYLRVFATDLEIDDFEFEILNRWGDRIYYTRNYYDVWNGYVDNVKVPAGRYLYSVVGTSRTTGQTYEKTDFIFILY